MYNIDIISDLKNNVRVRDLEIDRLKKELELSELKVTNRDRELLAKDKIIAAKDVTILNRNKWLKKFSLILKKRVENEITTKTC